MRFLVPGWLALLAAVAALIVAYVVVQRRRSRYAVRFAAFPLLERVMPREPGWRRHVPAIAFLLTVTGLVLGMARPVLEVQVPRERATIVVAVDVSMSMGAQDVAPSRIAAAVAAARGFVTELPEAFPVGLVLFSGASAVTVPPTPDRTAVTTAFDRISLGPGTAIGDAVLTSLDAVRSTDSGAPPPPARIVLLSDGANTTGTPIPDAAAEAAAAGVPVSTIAYGTPTGTATIDGESVRVPGRRRGPGRAGRRQRRTRLPGRDRRRAGGRVRRHRLVDRVPHRGARGHERRARAGAARRPRRSRRVPGLVLQAAVKPQDRSLPRPRPPAMVAP